MKNPRLTPLCIVLLTALPFLLPAQNLQWAVGNIGASTSVDNQLVLDKTGSILTRGHMNPSTDLDPGPAVLNLGTGDYLQKLDSNGLLVWVIDFPLAIMEMALDTNDNIFVAGYFSDSVDADPGAGVHMLYESAISGGLGVVKLSPSGAFMDAFAMDYTGSGQIYKLLPEEDGGLVMAGLYQGTFDADPSAGVTTLPIYTTYSNMFVIRLNPSMALDWYYTPEYITGSPFPRGLVKDGMGGYLVAGDSHGTADMDPGPGSMPIGITTDGGATVVRLTSTGTIDWARGMGRPVPYGGLAIRGFELLPGGNFVIAGQMDMTLDFDPGPGIDTLTSALDGSGFMACYNSVGDLVWAHALETPSFAYSFTSNGIGDLFLMGMARDTIDLDFSPSFEYFLPSDIGDGFIIKVNQYGHFIWGGVIPGNSAEVIADGAATPSGNIVLNGFFTAGHDFDLGPPVYSLPMAFYAGDFIARYQDDPCALYINMDTLHGLTCSITSGYAEVTALGGALPYSYVWSTTPPTTTPTVIFPAGGLYGLSVTDVAGCILERDVWVPFPDVTAGVDLTPFYSGMFIRIGYDNFHWAHGVNNGCTTQSGTFEIILDPGLTLVSATPTPDLTVGDTLRWLFTDLNYDSLGLHPMLNLHSSASLSSGDTAWIELNMYPTAGDADPLNNHLMVPVRIATSCDPNYKQVLPEGVCPEHYVLKDQPLTYTLHFQNIGTDSALNILVADTLDSDLDISTFRVQEQSHSLWTEIVDGHILLFHFDNIYLPDSATNEPGSQGHVIFEISPKPGLADGTEVVNGSAIYFDFNPAVITNTVTNTLVSSIPACASIGIQDATHQKPLVTLHPNPAQDILTITSEEPILQLQVINLMGQVEKVIPSTPRQHSINVSQWPAGIYLIQVETTTGMKTLKAQIQ